MESVQQRMKRLGTHEKIVAFVQKQNQNYAFKRRYAVTRVKEFISECDKRGLNNHVSVGGLDSIILYLFINEVCHGMCQEYQHQRSKTRVYRVFTRHLEL